jgi:hypothetical protein
MLFFSENGVVVKVPYNHGFCASGRAGAAHQSKVSCIHVLHTKVYSSSTFLLLLFREIEHHAPVIISMTGNTTSITNLKLPAHGSGADTLGRERLKHFTFDYSYWSANSNDSHYASQEKVS